MPDKLGWVGFVAHDWHSLQPVAQEMGQVQVLVLAGIVDAEQVEGEYMESSQNPLTLDDHQSRCPNLCHGLHSLEVQHRPCR